jgi:hypothetical protein
MFEILKIEIKFSVKQFNFNEYLGNLISKDSQNV